MNLYDHPDWHALVRTIRERPEDDLPCLVAADWLEEQGEHDRGRLIRFGVENRGIPFNVTCGQTPTLIGGVYNEAWRLIERCYAVELGPPGVGYTIQRGFLTEIRCPWAFWEDHGDRLCEVEPVRRVDLTTNPRIDTFKKPRRMGKGIVERIAGVTVERAGLTHAELLSLRWPTILTDKWTLPDYRHVARGMVFHVPSDWYMRDYTQEGLDAMRLAGERAADRDHAALMELFRR